MNRIKKISLFAAPIAFILVLLLEPASSAEINKILAISSWMIIWWVFETFPIYITALLPMVLFPTMNIMSVQETFAPYASPIVFLFFGGFILALALQKHNLHERIAFNLLKLTGSKPNQVILGFTLATSLIAMWVSNTATALMLLPIAMSVLKVFEGTGSQNSKSSRNFNVAILLTIAYSANIGGIFTLIGTPPNMVYAGVFYQETGEEFPFLKWLEFGIPIGITLLIMSYLLITKVLYPIDNKEERHIKPLVERRLRGLGKLSSSEKKVIAIFSLTVTLWIFGSNLNSLFGYPVFSNTSTAMIGGLLMFIVPESLSSNTFILKWEDTREIPWGLLLLFGGGLSLASGLSKSGILDYVGQFMANQQDVGLIGLMLIITGISLFATELMSNVALVTILLPIVFAVSSYLGVNQSLLTIPVTISASCAFMMPISTPPNAVVYSTNMINTTQMIKAGLVLNLISIFVVVMWTYILV